MSSSVPSINSPSINSKSIVAPSSVGALPIPRVNAPLVLDNQACVEPRQDVPPGKIMIVDDEIANVLVAKILVDLQQRWLAMLPQPLRSTAERYGQASSTLILT